MNRSRLSIIVGVSLIFLAHLASAQSPSAKAKAPLNNAASRDKSDAKAEADRIAKERRAPYPRSGSCGHKISSASNSDIFKSTSRSNRAAISISSVEVCRVGLIN
jgi:hypothetical protein